MNNHLGRSIDAPRASEVSSVTKIGYWLHPVTSKVHDRQLHFRVGLVGIVFILLGLALTGLATWAAIFNSAFNSGGRENLDSGSLIAAALLVGISVFGPAAIFRTTSSALEPNVVDNSLTPIRPWSSTTISFDSLVVGAMLAGLYFPIGLTFTFIGIALILRLMFRTRSHLGRDPNARFHDLFTALADAGAALAAYAIANSLAALASHEGSPIPLLFAAVAALFATLGFNALFRWTIYEKAPWAFLQGLSDPRRIALVFFGGMTAWGVAAVGEVVGQSFTPENDSVGALAGLGVFISAWAFLWVLSISLWRRDARKTFTSWHEQISHVTARLAEGSLSPSLARAAAVNTMSRIAVTSFGAVHSRVIVAGTANVATHFSETELSNSAAILAFPESPIEASAHPQISPSTIISISPQNAAHSLGSVQISGWQTPGSFLLRSPAIVKEFSHLAATALLTPSLASTYADPKAAFGSLFTKGHLNPNMAAFDQAVRLFSKEVDSAPDRCSLAVGVFEIAHFASLHSNGLDTEAISHIFRVVNSSSWFGGGEVFIAYESPGRVWIACLGGPIIRNTIQGFSSLTEVINNGSNLPSQRVDLGFDTSVEIGHSIYLIDSMSPEGLLTGAVESLEKMKNSRLDRVAPQAAFAHVKAADFMEDPRDSAHLPLTHVDLLSALRNELRQNEIAFPTALVAVRGCSDPREYGIAVHVGWNFSTESMNFASPESFGQACSKQPDLASEFTKIQLSQLRRLVASRSELDSELAPFLIDLPGILLDPDAGSLALPNHVGRELDQIACAQMVAVFDYLPPGSGQAVSLLVDRGIRVAIHASAASSLNPVDLLGWQRWGIIFDHTYFDVEKGTDRLMIQQVNSTLGSVNTHLIAQTLNSTSTSTVIAAGMTCMMPEVN